MVVITYRTPHEADRDNGIVKHIIIDGRMMASIERVNGIHSVRSKGSDVTGRGFSSLAKLMEHIERK